MYSLARASTTPWTDVIAALRQAASELAEGALVTIEPGRKRITLLPLR
jgi:hypothetical protein